MDSENTKLRTIKVRILPNKHQKEYFNKCANIHRYFKNKAIEEINDRFSNKKEKYNKHKTCLFCDNKKIKIINKNDNKIEYSYTCEKHINRKINWNMDINLASIRKSILKSNKEINENFPELKWQTHIPYDTRQLAIKEVITSYKSACTNKINGNIKDFKLRFIKRNTISKSFWVDHRAIKIKNDKLFIFPTKLKNKIFIQKSVLIKLKNALEENDNIFNDTQLYFNRKKWYLLLTAPIIKEKHKNRNAGISYDPGQVIPLAGYIPDKKICLKIGVDIMNKVSSIKTRIDKLNSKKDKIKNNKKKKKLKIKIGKLEFKIKNIIKDFHNQTAAWTAKNNDNVLLPIFETSKMQKGGDLKSKTKEKLNLIKHYQFQQTLKYQCWKHNSKFYLVDEHYTSRTCPGCGHWNQKNTTNRIFSCAHCKIKGNRDFIGSCNILLKTLTEHHN